MKRQNTQSITDLLGAFLRENDLETPYLQHRLLNEWAEVVGETTSSRTTALEVREEVLWVEVTSNALVTELQMQRANLVARLNERVGACIIRDIRFIPR